MSDIKLLPLRESDEGLYNDFVEQSINGTFYHNLSFIKLYGCKAKRTITVVFKKRDKIMSVLAGGIIENNGSLTFSSPFSASFTGFCYSKEVKLRDAFDIIALLETHLKSNGISEVTLQHPPIIYCNSLDERFDFALNYSGFKIGTADLTFYIESLSAISSSVLRNVKKAEASGLLFRETEECERVWNFLRQQKSKKGVYFSISLNELKSLKDIFKEKVRFFGVYKGGELLSAMILYCLNRNTALGFTWAQCEEYQILRPTDYLIYNVSRVVFAEGYRFFDLGTGTIGGEPVWGVTRFKENYSPGSAMRKKYIKTLS
ncbi:MAG: GNAT family N-acetyltransferase [Nitrospirae bacterium]|nr:GNAT family N-acetyltransferase [Nitrospirota bacterium]